MSRWGFVPSTEATLADIRFYPYAIPQSDWEPVRFAARVTRLGRALLNRMGLPRIHYVAAMHLVHALAPVFRKNRGEGLVRELELVWIRWDGMGMNEELVRAVTCGLYRAMVGRPELEQGNGAR